MTKAILFIILFSSSSLWSRDFASWRKEDIARVAWEFITRHQAELTARANAAADITGKKVEIQFLHNTKMDRKQTLVHERFLKYRLSESQIHEHVTPYLVELEKNRLLVVNAEEEASKIWEEKNKAGEMKEDVTNEAELYGTKIKSANLGVVLDNSNSMAAFLPKLREEIGTKFKNSHFVEIYGSILNLGFNEDITKNLWFYLTPQKGENPFLKKWYCPEYPSKNIHYFVAGLEQDNLSAIAALAMERKVDTIYWFTDMKDKGYDNAEKALGIILTKHNVKLYVHTLSQMPRTSVRNIIKASGGEVIRKRIR